VLRIVDLLEYLEKHLPYQLDHVSLLSCEVHACGATDYARSLAVQMKCCAQQSRHKGQLLYRNYRYTQNSSFEERDPWIESVPGLN
jgi:hypothetical protein